MQIFPLVCMLASRLQEEYLAFSEADGMTRLRRVAEATSAATTPTVAAYRAALCEELRIVDASLNRLQKAHCAQLAGPRTREDRLSLLGLEFALQVTGFLSCSEYWHRL